MWPVDSEVAFGQMKGKVSRQLQTWVLKTGLDWRRKSGTHWHSGKTGGSPGRWGQGVAVVKKETKDLKKKWAVS